MDVVEIDAASHNGVDDARELRERAIFAPSRDRFKVFILDEAHMVTQQGFNALLKIVEEPPPHVKFIFATTEPEKVLTTIRSRTHHYPFRLVPPAEMLEYLRSVVETERIAVEEGVLPLVVRSGGGSVRDSLSLLDQLIVGAGDGAVMVDTSQKLLGFTSQGLLDEVVRALAQRDSRGAFQALGQVVESGQDAKRFTEELLRHLRDLVVAQATDGTGLGLFPGSTAEDVESLKIQAGMFPSGDLSRMAEIVSQSLGEMSGVTPPILLLELLMARLVTNASDENVPTVTHGPPLPLAAVDAASQRRSKEESRSTEKGEGNGAEKPISPTTNSPTHSEVDWTLASLISLWPELLEEIAETKRSLWVALSETTPTALEDDVLTIGFSKKSDADILRKPQGPGSPLPNADLLRDAIERRCGRRVRFTVSELPATKASTPSNVVEPAEVEWPLVSSVASSPSTGADSDAVQDIENLSPDPITESHGDSGASDTVLATRGEPVVRQLLGGELVGEELLDQMSDKGEADV